MQEVQWRRTHARHYDILTAGIWWSLPNEVLIDCIWWSLPNEVLIDSGWQRFLDKVGEVEKTLFSANRKSGEVSEGGSDVIERDTRFITGEQRHFALTAAERSISVDLAYTSCHSRVTTLQTIDICRPGMHKLPQSSHDITNDRYL